MNMVTVKFARKPSDLNEVRAEIRGDCHPVACEIAETVELDAEAYDAFARTLYKNCDWLDGKGGDKNGRRQVLAVTAPGRETLYVNPEGYSYAREVGLAISTF